MTIDLEPGKQPPSGKLYSLSPDELELLKEYLDEMLKNGKIRHSKSSAVMDFSDFDEILEYAKYVGLIRVGEMESPQVPTGQAFDVMQITVVEKLQGLVERLPTQYRDFV